MENMGEIDTKPIESVQAALSLFGEKGDHRKSRSTSIDLDIEKGTEVESLLKDLANNKVQLEARDASYKQTLLKLDHYRKVTDELSSLLKDCEVERDKYIFECGEARSRIDELESKLKEMGDQLSETVKIREQMSHVLNELNAAQGELLSMETELASARDLELKAKTQAELMETAAAMEKEKSEELLNHIAELNEAVLVSKLAAIETEKEKFEIISEKDAELESVITTAVQAKEQQEDMRKQLEMLQGLENQLMAKSIFIDSLQFELKQANEELSSSEKAASDAINDLNQLKSDLELMEQENSDQTVYTEALEMELNRLKLELKNANEEVGRVNCSNEMLLSELQEAKAKMDDIRGRDTEAQVQIALLKSELHKGRSKLAAAEAAEARALSAKSGLYLAVQQLAVEAEEAKKENQRLKQGEDERAEETENSDHINPQFENSSQDVEFSQTDESKTEAEVIDEDDIRVTIPLKEYESLIDKAEKADRIQISPPDNSNQSIVYENKNELEMMKKELEATTVKIGEFRTRAEQAVSRAELAEKAKTAVEDQLRKWREQKQRRKAALAALREESAPRVYNAPSYDRPPTSYQPLGGWMAKHGADENARIPS